MKTISKPVIDRLPVNQIDEFACRQLDRVSIFFFQVNVVAARCGFGIIWPCLSSHCHRSSVAFHTWNRPLEAWTVCGVNVLPDASSDISLELSSRRLLLRLICFEIIVELLSEYTVMTHADISFFLA